MNLTRNSAALIFLIGIFMCSGCAEAGQPVTPSGELMTSGSTESVAGHQLWGYYDIYIDPEELRAKVVPGRFANEHWNILKFLEYGSCADCLTVALHPSGTGTVLADVTIKHPFVSKNLTGFDVRGICMFSGSYFSDWGYFFPDRNMGDGEVLNPDGYINHYRPSTAGSGPGGLQGYLKGKFATNTEPANNLSAFKRYVSDDPANTRNAFYSGDTIMVTYEIDMPDSAFVMGYAIDANWAPPTVKPVVDPMTDFPPEANCPEAWKITVAAEDIGDGLTAQGGSIKLTIDVYDHQTKDTYFYPLLLCPALVDGPLYGAWVSDESDFTRWDVTVSNVKLAGEGDYKILVWVTDKEDETAPAWFDLSSYVVQNVTVKP